MPIRVEEVPADEKLLVLALLHNLAVYDASYLSLGQARALAVATVDGKLQDAACSAGLQVIRP